MKLNTFILLLTLSGIAKANTWEEWKSDFYQKGLESGIPNSLMDNFINTVKPYKKAVSNDKSQAEFKKFIWDYLSSAVSSSRVSNGKSKFKENRQLLSEISKSTGVSPQYIAAIWGMETSYGGYMGKVPIINAMATLAFEGRRKVFFEGELISALKLINNSDIPSLHVKGSWAGGMGHTQFIPTTYNNYAVDFNSDGNRNLWDKEDALASTGNYLNKMGWVEGYAWGREISLPESFNYLLANDKEWRSLSEWNDLNVRTITGNSLATSPIDAQLFVPAGRFGPKFLLYKNFSVIKKYNNSDTYALGVSLLADKIAGNQPLMTEWPKNAKQLTKVDIKTLQANLNDKGFNVGGIDGILGNGTRRAIQHFQQSKNMIADGFVTNYIFNLITGNN